MGVEKTWLWNVKTTDADAREILKDPANQRFFIYAAKRLATANLPREVFREYLSREHFLIHWPRIKRQMRKDAWNRARVIFWQGVYDYLIRALKEKGTPFVRPKAEARVDPEQKIEGEKLRALRCSMKMTQSELAKKAGLTQQHIAKIEKGLTCPRPQTLAKIKRCLGPAPYEYKVDETPLRADRVTEPGPRPPRRISPAATPAADQSRAPLLPVVTTWFDPDPGRRTESR